MSSALMHFAVLRPSTTLYAALLLRYTTLNTTLYCDCEPVIVIHSTTTLYYAILGHLDRELERLIPDWK